MTLATEMAPVVRIGTNVVRVLHVRTVSGNGGGPEKTILRGAVHLPVLGVHAEALYLLDAAGDSDALLRRAAGCEMPIHVVRERHTLDPAGPAAFARLVRGGHFHIVHTHDYKSNTLARLFRHAGDYRIVATAHGYNRTTRRESGYYALERLLLRHVDAVICPASDLAGKLIDSGVHRRRISVVNNGVDLGDWPFRPRRPHGGPTNVLYLGRLSDEKNAPALLRATEQLVADGLALNVRLAGEGPAREAVAALIDEFRLSGSTELLGHRDDVDDLLAQADMLVNPSLTEAMPNCVLEAQAAGAPVIATDVGATDELVVHEHTGLLVPPDDIEALADAMRRLVQRPDFAQRLAVQARAHVEQHFDFATRMAHVVAIYRGVLAEARRSA